ncbi:RloB domain-containing protein [Pseudorhodoplanes sp.]|uniref:RloB domain-containing protein n=1 Tax=Pseudorhodoplanes sp. TaxID=1934341 RepID=UPI003D0F763E
MSRRPVIPQRTPIFLGGEGASEAGYGALIAKLARERGLHVHLDIHSLQPGAGDPHALVEKALKLIRQRERVRSAYKIKAIFLDVGSARKNVEATALARENGIDYLIWQEPDHEALLLRHMDNCQQRRPPAGESMRALLREWPDYRKAMSAQELGTKITQAHIQLACGVEESLAAFLRRVGLV